MRSSAINLGVLDFQRRWLADVDMSGEEARHIEKIKNQKLISLDEVRTYNQIGARNFIRNVMDSNKGYAKLSVLSEKLEMSEVKLERILLRDKAFLKSLIRLPNGDSLYTLNDRFAVLKDAWRAFCYINYLKY